MSFLTDDVEDDRANGPGYLRCLEGYLRDSWDIGKNESVFRYEYIYERNKVEIK